METKGSRTFQLSLEIPNSAKNNNGKIKLSLESFVGQYRLSHMDLNAFVYT